jgi:hypothetical protein
MAAGGAMRCVFERENVGDTTLRFAKTQQNKQTYIGQASVVYNKHSGKLIQR